MAVSVSFEVEAPPSPVFRAACLVAVAVEVEDASDRSESEALEVDLARFGSLGGGRKTSPPSFLADVDPSFSLSSARPLDLELDLAVAFEVEELRRLSSIREFFPTA